jgi:hypothetical protein
MACAITISSISVARIATLCFLLAGDASAILLPKGPDTEAAPTLVRVDIVTETRGAKDTVEINGKLIADYSPTIIQVFSSTGIVLDGKGHIMTFLGYHWVDIPTHDSRIEIAASGGQKYRGRLIGIDQSSGVAVIELLGGKLKKTPICADCEVKDGATIMAPIIGHYGPSQFQEAQILSIGTSQGIPMQDGWTIQMNRPFPDVGLPVLTEDHRILGFVASQDPMGFRTIIYPISQLLSSAEKILQKGSDIRAGWLGVFLADSQPATQSGVLVQRVEQDSPAEKAGLASEDFLLKYDGQEIRDMRQFIQLVQRTPIGSRAVLDIIRQGNPMTINAAIEARRPQPARGRLAFSLPGAINTQAAGRDPEAKRLSPQPLVGLDTIVLTPPLADAMQIPVKAGLLVIDVSKQSPADLAGVLIGDVIMAMGGQPITDAPSFASFLQTLDWGAQLELRILRKGTELTITVQLPEQGR